MHTGAGTTPQSLLESPWRRRSSGHRRHGPAGACSALCLLLAVIVAVLGASGAEAFQGPLRVSNGFPVFQGTAAPPLSPAGCTTMFGIHMNYSSTYQVREGEAWRFAMDLETLILDFQVRKTVADGLEIGLEMPLISYNSGFMDGLLEFYHDAFGFPDYGRDARPRNDFLFAVDRNAARLVDGEAGEVAMGDLRLGVKKTIVDVDPTVSVMGYVEIPTGDAERGYGNGTVDGGVAVLVSRMFGDRFTVEGNLGVRLLDSLKARKRIDLDSYLYGGVDLEWSWSEGTSLNVQLFVQGSPFPQTGIRQIDEPAVVLSIGGTFGLTPDSSLQWAFSEDPNTAGAPDLQMILGYRRTL